LSNNLIVVGKVHLKFNVVEGYFRRDISMLRTMAKTFRTPPQSSFTVGQGSKPLNSSRKIQFTSSMSTVLTNLKPWNQPMIESYGDYRKEAFLETHIGGPLYEHQRLLPRLPVPLLEETMNRFLPTALPLSKSKQEAETLRRACEVFPQQAAELQERLLHRANVEMADSSWLQLWWNTWGYLQVRESVVINVSYFFHFADDPSAATGTARGAAILFAATEFRNRVASGMFPAETIGGRGQTPPTPLCSVAFKYMFHACRIPHRKQDSYRIYDPSRYQHAIVARQGHFFAIPLLDSTTGIPFSLKDLESTLEHIVQVADASPSPACGLGILSSQNRDDWADSRESLLKAGGVAMEHALEVLESGALLLCMDDEQPISELFLHGGLKSGHNRWFDKSIQIICTNNGKAGLLGEHSMMDGMPMVALADHIIKTTYKDASNRSPPASLGAPTAENIFESLQSCLQRSDIPSHVDQASTFFANWIDEHEIHVQNFEGYGTAFIKKAGFSPDAFVQMVMQLATYRLWGELGGTYEATQVRPFLHGRTETTRTVSPQSHAFVKRMGLVPHWIENKDEKIREEKILLLRNAVETHVKYMSSAAKGMGVDRHLLGLQFLVKEGEISPDLFSHPLFLRSKTWRVSTSNLSHPQFENWGYGEVTPTGVGLSYSIHTNRCTFNVTSLKGTGYSERLCHHLEEALHELRVLVETESPVISRL
jgi:carnitine O-acetyltransferase